MKHSDFGSLPPCVLSTQCRRLLNDLDAPDVTNSFEQVFSTTTSDRRDELLLEQLRRHLPGCPTGRLIQRPRNTEPAFLVEPRWSATAIT